MTKIDVASYSSTLLLLKFLVQWLTVLGRWSGRIMDAVLSTGLVAEVHSIYL